MHCGQKRSREVEQVILQQMQECNAQSWWCRNIGPGYSIEQIDEAAAALMEDLKLDAGALR
jgi:hypothetical protein